MTCKNPLSSGPAELMIKQGRLPGGVGLKQEEGWKFFQIDPLQFICPRVGAEENGALSDRRGQEGLTELETVSA